VSCTLKWVRLQKTLLHVRCGTLHYHPSSNCPVVAEPVILHFEIHPDWSNENRDAGQDFGTMEDFRVTKAGPTCQLIVFCFCSMGKCKVRITLAQSPAEYE